MSELYKLVKTDKTFDVVEFQTEQVVFSHKDRQASHTKYRFLKGGGGFNGRTPAFFLTKGKE
jgi:hypothetical protein